MTIQQLLDLNVLEIFGLDKMSRDEQKQFLDYAAGIVLDRAIKQVLEELPKEKKEQFLDLLKGGVSDEEKAAFVRENVPDLEAIIIEEILIFKKEAEELASELKPEARSQNTEKIPNNQYPNDSKDI